MRTGDVIRLTTGAFLGNRLRSSLTLLAMAIGVAAVVLLTALGDGARRYVVDQFASLGTNLLIVLPGRSETKGAAPPLLGEIPRDLTIDDALALTRSRSVARVAPVVVGSAPVAVDRLERESTVLGSTAEMRIMRRLRVSSGRFLPAGDPRRPRPVCVLGAELRDELFGRERALGRWVRIGDRKFRVIGLLAPGGQQLGLDLGEVVIVPVASAQALFDTASLFRVIVEAESRAAIPAARSDVLRIIRERHDGEDDVTVITQDSVLATFDRILGAMTFALAGIAAISLIVAGVLVMNVMLVSVAQRTAEIGLLKAIGASRSQIMTLFLAEAAMLSILGGLLGLVAGIAGAAAAARLYPLLPIAPPAWSLVAGLGIAVGTGLLFGVAPARRAAALDAVAALAGH